VFVHIDRDAVFDPHVVYQQTNLRMTEVLYSIEAASTVLDRLYIELYGETFMAPLQQSLGTLTADFRRDYAIALHRKRK
jgi:hypothetical protein